jgi:hypothetical protein
MNKALLLMPELLIMRAIRSSFTEVFGYPPETMMLAPAEDKPDRTLTPEPWPEEDPVKLRAEVERLRKQMAAVEAEWHGDMTAKIQECKDAYTRGDALSADLATLRAENERLREALEAVCVWDQLQDEPFTDVLGRARAALKG